MAANRCTEFLERCIRKSTAADNEHVTLELQTQGDHQPCIYYTKTSTYFYMHTHMGNSHKDRHIYICR